MLKEATVKATSNKQRPAGHAATKEYNKACQREQGKSRAWHLPKGMQQ
jgi:hypothetical protein